MHNIPRFDDHQKDIAWISENQGCKKRKNAKRKNPTMFPHYEMQKAGLESDEMKGPGAQTARSRRVTMPAVLTYRIRHASPGDRRSLQLGCPSGMKPAVPKPS